MKRYEFRLEAVLRVRRIQEARARADLAMANLAVTAANQALAAKVDAYAQLPRPVGVMEQPAFFGTQDRLERSAATVIDLGERRDAAKRHAAEQHAVWSETAQRVSALERLDERQREEYDLETQRAVDREVDDLVVSRYLRAREATS